MTIFKEYRFEAAHQLMRVPDDHKCRRLHGHSYRLRVYVVGPVNELGMVMDFADLDALVKPIIEQLDHQFLNDVIGTDQPTCEAILQWIAPRLNVGGRLELWETATCGASMETVKRLYPFSGGTK